jgi:hypothetical protein
MVLAVALHLPAQFRKACLTSLLLLFGNFAFFDLPQVCLKLWSGISVQSSVYILGEVLQLDVDDYKCREAGDEQGSFHAYKLHASHK